MKLGDVGYSKRLLILFSFPALPFLRMLLTDGYGFAHLEVAVAMLIFAGVAALLAAALRSPAALAAGVLALSILFSVNALQMDLLPAVRFRWLIIGMAAVLAGAIMLLKRYFYTVLLVFLYGSFAVDLGKAIRLQAEGAGAARDAGETGKGSRNLRHVVHVVFDEMIGLGAMPPECTECVAAATSLERVFTRGNFQIYPHAYSNYRGTWDSVPSILNGRLLKRTGEFLEEAARRPVLRRNRYFDSYRAKGYEIRAYQSDYLVFSSPDQPATHGVTYRSNNLKALHSIPMGWYPRLRQLFVIYLQSDRFWWDLYTHSLPPRYHPRRLPVGPLAYREIWPHRVLADYRGATKNTLFFLHLMGPHYPYVYRRDGSVRDPVDWKSHSILHLTGDKEAEYRRRYRLYGEQVEFLAAELEAFLEQAKATGLYDSTTFVIHGDHGSRLRLLKASESGHRARIAAAPGSCPPVSRYDYPGEPGSRDLLNRFATLLAIKLPGASAPEVITTPGSVLHFLRGAFEYGESVDSPGDLNSVFLFGPEGSPRKLDILPAFRSLRPDDPTN